MLFLPRNVLGAEWDEATDVDRAQEPEQQYVFPSVRRSEDLRSGAIKRHHRSPSAVQKAVTRAVERTDITKSASCHTLRPERSEEVVSDGDTRLRRISWNRARTSAPCRSSSAIKTLRTTQVYTHVLQDGQVGTRSPLEGLGSDGA